MTSSGIDKEFNLQQFYSKLIRPQTFKCNQLLANENQVAGHAGFYSLQAEPTNCLKPFNTKCVRGRREHLFYQLIEYFKRKKISINKEGSLDRETLPESEEDVKYTGDSPLLYKHFTLLTYPSPATHCNCIINEALFNLLSSFVAKFYHVKHISQHNPNEENNPNELLDSVYSQQLTCPCYGRNPIKKSSCSRDYEKIDFLCLEDLTAHCVKPCIIDIKIGQITYDPMAIKEKVLEQSSKYRRLREFGFRILGMKLGNEIKDKNYGKTLETTEQVYEALDSFFKPLSESNHKCVVTNQILVRLRELYGWFENENINQLKFFSSSLLIVYDSHVSDKNGSADLITHQLIDNVRVSMIDFAHIFHVHDDTPMGSGESKVPDNRDNNYMYGLRKLEEFFSQVESSLLSISSSSFRPSSIVTVSPSSSSSSGIAPSFSVILAKPTATLCVDSFIAILSFK